MPTHYGQLAYDKCAKGKSFESSWNTDRAILKSCVVLSLVSCICFLICTEASWFSHKAKMNLSKYMIGVMSVLVAIWMIFAMVYAERSLNFINTSSLYGKISDHYITMGKILIWVIFVLIMLNIAVVLAKFNKLGVAFVIAYAIIILLLVTSGGIFLRKTKVLQKATLPPLCYSMLNDADMNQVSGFCPKKYSDTALGCSKSYSGTNWESKTDNTAVKNMNLTCCHPTVNYYTYSLMIYGLHLFLIAIT